MIIYSACSDQELILLLKENDHDAFVEIYHRYSEPLYRHAYKMLRDREVAKDLIQELFTVLWSKRSEFVLQASLSSYLFTATRNRVIKIISHKSIESVYFSSIQKSINQGNAITDHLVREKELSAIIEKEIDKLPRKMRTVFNLSRKDQLSHSEIAAQLNISESTVKKQVNNALKILRVKLEIYRPILLFFLP